MMKNNKWTTAARIISYHCARIDLSTAQTNAMLKALGHPQVIKDGLSKYNKRLCKKILDLQTNFPSYSDRLSRDHNEGRLSGSSIIKAAGLKLANGTY